MGLEEKAFQSKPLKEWSSNDISNWLASIGMKAYITTFKNELITGKHLCKFVEDDLRTKCKITARPIRKILFKRLKHVQGRWKTDNDDESDEEDKVPPIEEPPNVSLEVDLSAQPLTPPQPEPVEENNDEPDDGNRELTPEEAAFRIESLYQCWKGHKVVVRLIEEQYRKRYSIQTGRYVYVYIGKSSLMSGMPNKKKPVHLGSLDLSIEFTKELAMMRIQLFARYCFIIRQVRKMIRLQWRRMIDPVSGKYFYYHAKSGTKSWYKPSLLGRERWDPMDMKLWTIGDVKFHFRRLQMGLSRTTIVNDMVQQYQIDGDTLLTFDEVDLALLGIPPEQRKRIIEDMKLVQRIQNFDLTPIRRRENFRHNYRIIHAAITIQRNYRRFNSATKFSKLLDTLKRSKRNQIGYTCEEQNPWWTNCPLQTITVYFYHMSQSRENALLKSLLQTDDSLTLKYDKVVL